MKPIQPGIRQLVLTLALSLMPLAAQAVPIGTTPDTRPAAPQQRKQWKQQGVNLNFSGLFLNGNVNMLNLSGTLSYNLNIGKHQIFFDAGQLYTQAGSNLVANRINGTLLYAYNALDNLNLYGYTTHARDESIKLDYRLTNGVGLCWHKILPDFFNLSLLSAGVATENEWFKDQTSPFAVRAVLRLALSRPLTDWAELGLDSFYTPAFHDFSDFRVYAEAYLKFQLNELLSLKLSAADEYDSKPLAGVQNNDFGVFSTLSFDWGV